MSYYLLEKYKGYEGERDGYWCTRWDVHSYRTLSELEKAIRQGPKHGGELFAAKGLEMKIKLIELRDGEDSSGRGSVPDPNLRDHY